MNFDLIIRNGEVITSTAHQNTDVGICGDAITEIGSDLKSDTPCKEIDASEKIVMPGGIDVHVHFNHKFCGHETPEDFFHGTRAAAHGGVTSIIDFASPSADGDMMRGITERIAQADGNACIDFGLHANIFKWNNKTPSEMEQAIELGVPTFKMFMIYAKEGWQSDDAALFEALEFSASHDARIMVHAESESVLSMLVDRFQPQSKELGAYAHAISRPNFIEAEAVMRAITWSGATGGKLYIVHTSTAEAADIIKAGRAQGIDVLAETCPQYLLLTDEIFKNPTIGHLYATCPQLKGTADCGRLWSAIADGEISIVSTDSCTFTRAQKDTWNGDFTKIPYGMPGCETLLPAIFTHGVLANKFNAHKFVKLISTNPAKLMGLYPKKGEIAVGSDADIIIIDPAKKRLVRAGEIATNCDWHPFEGLELAGFPDHVISRGEEIVSENGFIGKKGRGKFLKRKLA